MKQYLQSILQLADMTTTTTNNNNNNKTSYAVVAKGRSNKALAEHFALGWYDYYY